MRRPAAKLTFDGSALSAAEAALVAMHVELGAGGAHDRFRATVAPGSPAADAEPGATAKIEMGYEDGLETVLTGAVTSLDRHPAGVVIEGLAGTAPLSAAWLGRSYVSQTVGDIVSDLVSSGGGTAGDVSATLSLSAYHVDERRTVWAHVRSLAWLTGAELTCDADGALNLRPATQASAAARTPAHGADVIEWDLGPCDPQPWDVTVVPFGAASEEGAEKWHVLLKEPEGSSPSSPTLVPGALRDRDGAQALEDALHAAADRRGLHGSLLLEGDGSLRAGDVVELSDMPSGEDGPYRIAEAHHLLDLAGFRTLLRVGATA